MTLLLRDGATQSWFAWVPSVHKFSLVDKKVLLHFFYLDAMSFHGAEIWFIKLNKKYLKNISLPYHKVIKRFCERNLR